MTDVTFTSSSDSGYTFVLGAFVGDDEEPPTLGVREPVRPLLPTIDGAVAVDLERGEP